jgi:hypothetical protein
MRPIRCGGIAIDCIIGTARPAIAAVIPTPGAVAAAAAAADAGWA